MTLRIVLGMLLVGIASTTTTTTAAAEDVTAWKHSKSLKFNTTPNGADVSQDVQNFPVAVALNAANFDFSQAKPDGADLRFTNEPTAGPLAHSIEHWDATAQSALVWVKVPTIRGNSDSQTIHMHWGNAAAASTADSSAVFDTRDGWVGVWHLGDEPTDAAGGYKDATANAADGTGLRLKPDSRVDARLGRGVSLNHDDNQWIKVDSDKRKLFDLTNKLTFSIWAKARSYANKGNEAQRALPGYETMFAKGDNSWRLQKFGIRDWHKPPAELVEICVERLTPKGDLCDVGTTDMVLDTWFHFVGVHDHPQVMLYVNGRLDKLETFNSEWKTDDHPVGIGNQSQFPDKGRSWDGVLDEARVLSVPKDEHWIKLDFESQKENQRFLTFSE
jgi:hypothetical protein